MKKIYFLLWLLGFYSPQVGASDYRQTSSELSWQKVSTDHFEVIYPEGLLSEARIVASSLEAVFGPVSEGLKISPARLSVILQAHTLQSNGFVALAPRRSEWFVTPWQGPQVGQTEWLRTLAVHEFRHVVQFDKSRTGFAKALRIVLGELGTALAIGWTLPSWYLEGDAVGIETALSSSGRGRQPGFEKELKAILLSGQDMSYEQLGLGNFTRYTPNHYVVGYFLTTYLRRKYGREVWEKIHFETMERAYNPLAFYNAIERVTGVGFDTHYRRALAELKALWLQELKGSVEQDSSPEWVSYQYPVKRGESFYALRESLSHISQYVRLTSKGEQVVFTPAPLVQEFPMKLRQDRLALAEVKLHPRWGMQDSSRLCVWDLKKEKVIFEKTGQFLAPALDHSATKLAAVEWPATLAPKLVMLSVETGKRLSEIPWERERAVLGLDFIPGSDDVVVLYREGVYELVLAVVNLVNGERRKLAASKSGNWAYPVATGEHVYFQSMQSGTDQIHRVSLRDGFEEQVTSSTFGAYHPWVEGDELVYADYTAAGLKPRVMKITGLSPSSSARHVPYYEPLVAQEGKGDILGKIASSELSESDYSRLANAWNPHSWMLLAPPFTPTVTAQIYSTDLLNTTDIAAGVNWSLNERVAQTFASLKWSYLYPAFDFSLSYGARRENPEDRPSDKWEEGRSDLGMSLPWRSLHGAFVQEAEVRFGGLALHAVARENTARGELSDNTLLGGVASLEWSLLRRMAERDLLPNWGADLRASATSARDTKRTSEESIHRIVRSQWYLPGLASHHALFGELTHEKQTADGYHFLSEVMFSRGHSSLFLENLQKSSVNYAFPLAYPEWAAGRYYYLKRLSLNLFYDNTWGHHYGASRRFESRGAELWIDNHLVRNAFGFQWGIRYNWPLGANDNWDIFLNTGVLSW